ncbi:MAG: molybdopterin-guanine dinucleotide biosynthesis protein B [Gammaproteobacteria bacterium]
MISIDIPLIGIAAYSGTGKTTLLTRLISIFKERGLRVGIIKHAHHTFEIDYPGKDSYELRKAGASQVLIGSSKRWALMVDAETDADKQLQHHISHLDLDSLDLILVEGFKPEAIPKIELNRADLGKPLLFPDDETIIAIATDSELNIPTSLPVLDLNKPRQIAEFIIDRYFTDNQNSAIADNE